MSQSLSFAKMMIGKLEVAHRNSICKKRQDNFVVVITREDDYRDRLVLDDGTRNDTLTSFCASHSPFIRQSVSITRMMAAEHMQRFEPNLEKR